MPYPKVVLQKKKEIIRSDNKGEARRTDRKKGRREVTELVTYMIIRVSQQHWQANNDSCSCLLFKNANKTKHIRGVKRKEERTNREERNSCSQMYLRAKICRVIILKAISKYNFWK